MCLTFTVIAVTADDLPPSGARASAGTVITNFCCIYSAQAFKGLMINFH